MKKCKILAVALAISLVALIGVSAYAAYLKSINAHVNITAVSQPQVGLTFYADEGCTTEANLVEFNSLPQGMTLVKTLFYAKNTGDVNATFIGGSTLPATVGTIAVRFNGNTNVTINTGDVVRVTGTITIRSDALVGDCGFSITMNQV
jgi:hypothetical protein